MNGGDFRPNHVSLCCCERWKASFERTPQKAIAGSVRQLSAAAIQSWKFITMSQASYAGHRTTSSPKLIVQDDWCVCKIRFNDNFQEIADVREVGGLSQSAKSASIAWCLA